MRMVLLQARTRKLEAESKLAGLQKDLAELGSVSGDQAGAEEAQTMQLHQVCFLASVSRLHHHHHHHDHHHHHFHQHHHGLMHHMPSLQ